MLADKLIPHIDTVLRTLFAPAATSRPYPDAGLQEGGMSAAQKQHALGLMRVNHVGEVCAQALYQGQALTARTPANREALQHAAYEEVEHLAWTAKRVHELGGRTSLLNPVWYAGSWTIGALAGLRGDGWNLGFVVETERQVEAHLASHMDRLPSGDTASRAIVAQMKEDEARHADDALHRGGAPLPAPVRGLMRLAARVMTTVAHRI